MGSSEIMRLIFNSRQFVLMPKMIAMTQPNSCNCSVLQRNVRFRMPGRDARSDIVHEGNAELLWFFLAGAKREFLFQIRWMRNVKRNYREFLR